MLGFIYAHIVANFVEYIIARWKKDKKYAI